MKISELTAPQKINMPLLVTQVKGGVTNAGKPYLSISLRDSSATIEGKMWEVNEESNQLIKAGKILMIKGDVINYRGSLQLKIMDCSEPVEKLDIKDFVMNSPYSEETLRNYINEEINTIQNRNIFRIVSDIYRQYDKSIYYSAAAVKNHHEYVGGLATHVYSMLHLAEMVCVNYPYLNRDLLIGGVLLHDIGKVVELKPGAVSEYTVEGNLLGHISISQTIIKESADRLNIDSEEVLLLRHMVLAHHGQYEYGSPVLPMTIEAEALHSIDDLDAKMTMIEKELNNIPTKSFTGRIFPLDNRSFYKHDI